MSKRNAISSLTNWVLGHKRIVAGAWLLITIAAFAALNPAGKALSNEFSVPGREGFETNQRIAATYGTGGDSAPIVPVVRLMKGITVDDPGVRAQLAHAMAKVTEAVPHSRAVSFADTGDRAFVSKDGRTTFGLVYIPAKQGVDPGQAEAKQADAALRGVTVAGSPVRVTGLDALRASAKTDKQSQGAGVMLEVLIAGIGALLVLAFVFASFTAFVPLLMAVVAIPTTFLLIWPLASITDVSVIVQFLVALIGLGIAIDYALLIVVRWREERQRDGASNEDAIREAMKHAGEAVVFSGSTVAIGMLALIALPMPALRSIGFAGVTIPLVSVAVAMTLLPVVLATIGPRLEGKRVRRGANQSRLWSAWARIVVRRRWVAAVGSAVLLGALVVGASTIQLGNPSAESLAQHGSARAGLAQLERSGIGTGVLSPYDALVKSGDAQHVTQVVAGVDGVRAAVAPDAWRHGSTALVTIIPSADGNSPQGRATLSRVRTALRDARVDAGVGGQAAQSADFLDAVYSKFPLMVALITGLTFVLLARAFRSIVLPLKAVALNLLSVAAAWGLMVLVWQHGFGSHAIWGIEATHAINVEMPVIVFAFLFGISMDYQVFIITRMREAYDRGASTDEAVVEGISRTGRLVTSAALILGLSFVAMSAGPGTEAKMFATALGGGVLLDATLVRGVLAPALVSLLGRWNWWLPTRPAQLLRVKPSLAQRREPQPEPAV